MSAGLIPNDAINDALQRAKELAANPSANLKRPISDESNLFPAKRANMDGGMQASLISTLGAPMSGSVAFGGLGATNHNENIVEVITVPDNTVGLVIGKGGEQISSIQSQSGARVQMSPDSDGSGYRQCTLQGTKMAIERAKQLIHEVISRAGSRRAGGEGGGMHHGQTTFEMLIPGSKCGLIIGKQGDTIKNLQEQTGVKMVMIQETQEATGQPKPLRMTGDPDKIEHAKRLVQELLNSRDDAGNRNNDFGGGGGVGGGGGGGGGTAKGEVVVPRASVGMIIGKGGETIKRLAMETGTKIQFKPDTDPSTSDRCAVIMGTREQIYKATELITELVQKSCSGQGPQETFYMHVPQNKTGLVIGKGGETIKQICSESGAHVELSREPPPNQSEKVFIIKGTPLQIHHAQHIIRIKVGDVPPGTPVPPFAGMGGGGAAMGRPDAFHNPAHFNGSQFPQMGGQWNNSFGGDPSQGNGWGQPQQFYGQQQAPAMPQAAYGGMQPAYAAQQYAAASAAPAAPAAAAASAVSSAPAINPQTGQPDYSAQWAEYYRSMGMHEQAAKIDQQMKAAQGGGQPGSAPSAPQGQFSAAGQPQQFGYAAAAAQPQQQPQGNFAFMG